MGTNPDTLYDLRATDDVRAALEDCQVCAGAHVGDVVAIDPSRVAADAPCQHPKTGSDTQNARIRGGQGAGSGHDRRAKAISVKSCTLSLVFSPAFRVAPTVT